MTPRVLTRRAHACADHRADHKWAVRLAAKHVAQFGTLIIDLIPADAEEIDKHQFGYWTHAGGSGPHRSTNETGFSDGRIEDAIASKLLHQALRDTQDTAPGFVVLQVIYVCSACYILTH